MLWLFPVSCFQAAQGAAKEPTAKPDLSDEILAKGKGCEVKRSQLDEAFIVLKANLAALRKKYSGIGSRKNRKSIAQSTGLYPTLNGKVDSSGQGGRGRGRPKNHHSLQNERRFGRRPSIAKSRRWDSRGRGFLLGSAYGAAMAVVYGVLGLVVILTAGTFGTINASPWFNLAIAVLFVVLGLAMFDVLVIDFSRFSAGMANPANRGTFAVAFTMGAVAALLAGACVAPVVIQVVLFSSSLYAAALRSRWRCRSCSASAWRFRGRLPAPVSRRCRSRASGWSASRKRSAC